MHVIKTIGIDVAPSSDIARVLGRLPSGLLVLTVRNGKQETGMLASWVMQAGFMPPAITVAVRRDRYIGQWLADGLPFVLSLLGSGQTGLLRHFRRGFSPGQSPFVTIEIERTAKGVAALRDALGYLECEPDGYMDSGDHRIFLAKITAGKMATELPPMIHVRRSGMHY